MNPDKYNLKLVWLAIFIDCEVSMNYGGKNHVASLFIQQ